MLLEQYKKKKKKLEMDITTSYNKKLEGIISPDEFKEQYNILKQQTKFAYIKEKHYLCIAFEI